MEEAILTLAWLRIAVLLFMLGFTLRYRDWCGMAIVVVYGAMVYTNTILELPYITTILSTPLVFLICFYIINHIRGKH